MLSIINGYIDIVIMGQRLVTDRTLIKIMEIPSDYYSLKNHGYSFVFKFHERFVTSTRRQEVAFPGL